LIEKFLILRFRTVLAIENESTRAAESSIYKKIKKRQIIILAVCIDIEKYKINIIFTP
jgi:hypothetical protein